MTTKHTPGPWKHDAPRDYILAVDGSLICKIATGENPAEEDANARLIAAAPNLLAELRLLTIDCCGPLDNNRGCGWCMTARDLILKASTQ